MRFTRLGIVLGAAAVILVLVTVAAGDSTLRAPVIAFVALVLLVAGGNWLNDYLGIKRRPQEFNRPDRPRDGEDER